MNQFALNRVLATQVREDWGPEEKATARLAQMGKRLRTAARHAPLSVPSTTTYQYQTRLPDTRKTYENMMDRIHMTMKSVRPPRRPRPIAPPPVVEAPVAPPPPLPTKRKRSKSRRIKGGGNSSRAASTSVFGNRINPLTVSKAQRVVRQSMSDIGQKCFNQRNRIREVIQQKSVLETMLQQHKKLQRDRQIIALDIQRMRADLDRIRNKLDTSLQNLNSTRTLFSVQPTKRSSGKNTIQKKSSHSVGPRRSSGSRKFRGKSKSSNSVPLNINKSSAVKRRSN
ncbi:uncharacterized protein [Drosophila bipectinata]|uniref:uncharacterized protein n=1 Tax=Drosophila bipectinata TaxID=42026 RepID=UPI001C8B04A3|nr:uncharacterized protein LOC108131156 [Drosophila bipectinata]